MGLGLVNKLKEDGVKFNIDYYPYELKPNAALEGENLFDSLPKDYVEKSFEMLAKLGEPYGIKFLNKDKKFNTHRAHLVGEYAKTQGKYDEFSKEAFKAYFVDIKNLADKEVLNEIAAKIGLDIKEMNKQIDEGKFDDILIDAIDLSQYYEVESVPTFIINEKGRLTGVRGYEQFKRSLLEMGE
ncbi:DsbA family protein [Alkaliphilus sp. MSJ-5]|uniref:DsbA family protein n=1 Tax=Alkaliphilus flagellatus TaxID=2841507 RepID=A0ABS6G409_9FIRM|nr:DsbA family protein [Alkaliphilus flagellatus]